MSDWKKERAEWYSKKISELVAESETCDNERFQEITIEITNYQNEINNMTGAQ